MAHQRLPSAGDALKTPHTVSLKVLRYSHYSYRRRYSLMLITDYPVPPSQLNTRSPIPPRSASPPPPPLHTPPPTPPKSSYLARCSTSPKPSAAPTLAKPFPAPSAPTMSFFPQTKHARLVACGYKVTCKPHLRHRARR